MEQCANLWVSVNLSALQLRNSDSRAAVQGILSDPDVEAHRVVLEVTETALTANVEGAIASLNAWKHYGVRIAIDDFGTGFSSLSTLVGLPVDILKIDHSFVSGHASGSAFAPVLEGIVELANKLSLDVIAEGIEQPEQRDRLRDMGCQLGQGYFLARPTGAHALKALLAAGGLLPLIVVPWPNRSAWL